MSANTAAFVTHIEKGYSFAGETLTLGSAVYEKTAQPGCLVRAPLRTLNRHGLIAGATGTGKTKTIQRFAEALSAHGVPVVLMDIKGDLSGLAVPGEPHPKIEERHRLIGLPRKPRACPVEFLSLSHEVGTRLRATVSEFGPVLFSRILEVNDTQAGVISLVFKYCDDHDLPLLDLRDFKQALHFLGNEGKAEISRDYGQISAASAGAILRKVVEIEQQGAEQFFGERSFDVQDLMRTDENGRGIISILRLTDIQSQPKMFSTFMLCLLAEIYSSFPEEGDLERPKLVLVIDEAHLTFREASTTLREQLETIIKLIRSKGVGIYFSTQSPVDIPASVLGQLGMKVQHALRAFTARDRKAIKLAAENYPLTSFYQTDQLLTELGIGEALVTVLNEKGAPTPLVHTLLCAPESRMGPLNKNEIDQIVSQSRLAGKYREPLDRESAHEILAAKLRTAATTAPPEGPPTKRPKSTLQTIASSSITRQIGRTVAREVTRGLLGVLGIGGRRRAKTSRWF